MNCSKNTIFNAFSPRVALRLVGNYLEYAMSVASSGVKCGAEGSYFVACIYILIVVHLYGMLLFLPPGGVLL